MARGVFDPERFVTAHRGFPALRRLKAKRFGLTALSFRPKTRNDTVVIS
jgi:hypothetical protein